MRSEFEKHVDNYTASLSNAEPADVPAIRAEFAQWYSGLTENEKEEIRPLWREDLEKAQELIEEVKELLNELQEIIEEERRKKAPKASA